MTKTQNVEAAIPLRRGSKWRHGFSVVEGGEGEARGQRHAETDFVDRFSLNQQDTRDNQEIGPQSAPLQHGKIQYGNRSKRMRTRIRGRLP